MSGQYGARVLPFTSNQALNGSVLIGGPGRLKGWSILDGSASNTLEADQTAAAPGAGVTITSLSLANGVYRVEWFLELGGTPGVGDIDNVALFIAATQIGQSANLGAVGEYGPFVAQANVVFGPLTLAAKAIGAATAGSTYRVLLQATQVANALCNIKDGGMTIASPVIPAQSADNKWLSERGVRVENSLSVQAIQGTISGVLYFEVFDEIDGRLGY